MACLPTRSHAFHPFLVRFQVEPRFRCGNWSLGDDDPFTPEPWPDEWDEEEGRVGVEEEEGEEEEEMQDEELGADNDGRGEGGREWCLPFASFNQFSVLDEGGEEEEMQEEEHHVDKDLSGEEGGREPYLPCINNMQGGDVKGQEGGDGFDKDQGAEGFDDDIQEWPAKPYSRGKRGTHKKRRVRFRRAKKRPRKAGQGQQGSEQFTEGRAADDDWIHQSATSSMHKAPRILRNGPRERVLRRRDSRGRRRRNRRRTRRKRRRMTRFLLGRGTWPHAVKVKFSP